MVITELSNHNLQFHREPPVGASLPHRPTGLFVLTTLISSSNIFPLRTSECLPVGLLGDLLACGFENCYN